MTYEHWPIISQCRARSRDGSQYLFAILDQTKSWRSFEKYRYHVSSILTSLQPILGIQTSIEQVTVYKKDNLS